MGEEKHVRVLFVITFCFQLYVYGIVMKNLFITKYHSQKELAKWCLKCTVFSPAREPEQVQFPRPESSAPTSLPKSSYTRS